MAFTSAISRRGYTGDGRREHQGTYTNTSGSTGGDISTGLNRVDELILQPVDSSVESNASVVNETFPVAGADITIVTDANQSGIWIAKGV